MKGNLFHNLENQFGILFIFVYIEYLQDSVLSSSLLCYSSSNVEW
jgi:hypothetical protein